MIETCLALKIISDIIFGLAIGWIVAAKGWPFYFVIIGCLLYTGFWFIINRFIGGVA